MEKQTNTKLSLYEKLHKVMEAVSFIPKDKENTFHKYMYASEAAIKKAIHAEMVKNKLLFFISQDSLVRTEKIAPKDGKQTFVTDIKIIYQFIDVETGEKIEGVAYGTGEDSGDKGTYKAITGAIKYALTSAFLIPTGDDPEKEDKKEEQKKEAPKQEQKTNGKVQPNTKAGLVEMTDAVCKKFCDRIMKGEKVGDEIKDAFILDDKHRDQLVDAMNKYKESQKGVAA